MLFDIGIPYLAEKAFDAPPVLNASILLNESGGRFGNWDSNITRAMASVCVL